MENRNRFNIPIYSDYVSDNCIYKYNVTMNPYYIDMSYNARWINGNRFGIQLKRNEK